MTDDDVIRLESIKAFVSTGRIVLNAEGKEDTSTLARAAWLFSESVLDLWHASTPYAPPFKCTHGKLRDEPCAECDKGEFPLFPPDASGVVLTNGQE